MKNIILLFLFLIPVFLFAQYPATGNKSRLGYQTTGDGLIWRGVAADTAIKPRTTANAYFQLDTVNRILRRYIATQGSWQVVGGGSVNIDSLIYATRYWVGSNFFPLEGGTLTGTGGAGFIGLPSQVTAPGTPASGLNIYAQGSGFNWKGTDGHERFFASTLTGGRTYTLPDISGTFALGTGTADRLARWTGTNTLAAGNISDNGTRLAALLPWQFHSWTTAGRPTGTTGYTGFNTTDNIPEWYNGSAWDQMHTPWLVSGANTYFNTGNVAIGTTPISTSRLYVSDNTFTLGPLLSMAQTRNNTNGNVLTPLASFVVSRTAGTSGNGANLVNITYSGEVAGTGKSLNISHLGGSNDNAVYIEHSGTSAATLYLKRINNLSSPVVFEMNSTDLAALSVGFTVSRTGGKISNGTRIGLFDVSGQTQTGGLPTLARVYAVMENNIQATFAGGFLFETYSSASAKNALRLFGSGYAAINTTTEVASAALNVSSTTRGILPPIWTSAQRTAISSPATGIFGYQTDGTEGVYFKQASTWKRLLWEGDITTIYTGDGTFGAGRIGTLTDSLRFRFGGADLFRLKSNGVLHVNMPTENNSFVITSTPSENYNNYRGNVFMVGTTSTGDTTTGIRRNNHDVSAFAGNNLVEGGNNVYGDAVFGYGNIIRGNNPKNIVVGTFNTTDDSDITIVGFLNTTTGRGIGIFGQNHTVAQDNAFIYGNGGSNVSQHGFGTVTPSARIHAKSLSGVPTILADGGEIQANAYGVGTKEAADLSKTESVYDAVFATDGTVIERHDKIERYYTITSTSSPQTLSNDYSDNLINQGGTQATFTLTFPASPVDGQVLKITYNNAITTLTLDGNGETIVGSAVVTGVAGSQRKFKFYSGIGWIKQY